MCWYRIYKQSALDPNWWQNFYEHLTKALPFVLNIQGTQSRFNSSGVDGSKVWYSFMIYRQPDIYSCGVQLEFAQGIPNGGGRLTWQDSSLHHVVPQNGNELVKLSWRVIKNMHTPNDSEVVGRGFILPQNATPVAVLTQIKNAILSDINGEDDNDNGPGPSPIDSPSPSTRQPVNVGY